MREEAQKTKLYKLRFVVVPVLFVPVVLALPALPTLLVAIVPVLTPPPALLPVRVRVRLAKVLLCLDVFLPHGPQCCPDQL